MTNRRQNFTRDILFTFSEKLNGQMFEEVISTVRKLCEAVSSDLETEMLEVSKINISTVRKLCEAVSSDLETEMLEVSKINISTVRKLCEAVSSDLETEMLEVSKIKIVVHNLRIHFITYLFTACFC